MMLEFWAIVTKREVIHSYVNNHNIILIIIIINNKIILGGITLKTFQVITKKLFLWVGRIRIQFSSKIPTPTVTQEIKINYIKHRGELLEATEKMLE